MQYLKSQRKECDHCRLHEMAFLFLWSDVISADVMWWEFIFKCKSMAYQFGLIERAERRDFLKKTKLWWFYWIDFKFTASRTGWGQHLRFPVF